MEGISELCGIAHSEARTAEADLTVVSHPNPHRRATRTDTSHDRAAKERSRSTA